MREIFSSTPRREGNYNSKTIKEEMFVDLKIGDLSMDVKYLIKFLYNVHVT